MKRVLKVAVGVLLAAAVVAGAASFSTGWGKTVTATTTTARVDFAPVGSLSVYNASGQLLQVLVNCTVGNFDDAVTAGTVIPIPTGTSFVFDGKGRGAVASICYSTAAGSGPVYLGGF